MITPQPPANDADGRESADEPQCVHQPVLVEPVCGLLRPKPGQVMLDCTLGVGGHAAVICPKLAPGGRYIGLDVDLGNITLARERLSSVSVDLDLYEANFRDAGVVLDELGVRGVDLLLADLGFSSNQMDDPARGFSFKVDGPLDMRLRPDLRRTAADLVNRLPEQELANIFYEFGQERKSRRVARKIIEHRRRSPINTTAELAELIRSCFRAKRPTGPPKRGVRGRKPIDPATRCFMALRIAVNDELGALESLLNGLPGLLRPGARAAVISFHSLEDRLVKRAFMGFERAGVAERLTPKPVTAGPDEQRVNRRSRSAKLRVMRWLGEAGGDQERSEVSVAS